MLQLKRKVFRSRLFLSWLLSYALILMLPLLIFTFVFWDSTNAARKDVYKSREAALWQFSQVFSQRLRDVEALAIKASALSELNAIRRSESSNAPDTMYNYWLLQKKLLEFCSDQSFIQSINLYFKQSDTLIGSQSQPDISNLWKKGAPELTKALHQCVLQLPNSASDRFLFLNTPSSSNVEGFLIYSYPFSAATNGQKEDAVLIVINIAELEQILTSSFYEYSGSFFITDGSSVLSLSGNAPFPKDLDLDFLKKEGCLEFSENGNLYNAMCLSAASEDLLYIHVFENEHFSGVVQRYLLLYGICVLVSIFAGFALSIFFSLHNYHPVQSLEQLFRDDLSGHSEEKIRQNELQMIFRQVQTLQKHNQIVEARLMQQSEQLREAILVRTLRGEISPAEQESVLVTNGFTLDEIACTVLLALLPEEKAEWCFKSLEGLFSAVSNEKEGIKLCPVQVNPHACVVLLTISCSIEDYKMQLKEAANHLAALLSKNYPGMYTACSSIHTDLRKISNAYAEAERVLEYNQMNDSAMLFYPERGNTDVPKSRIIQQISNADYAFLSCVRLHNFDGARNCLKQVLDSQKSIGIEMNRSRLYGLVNLLLAASAEISSRLSPDDCREMDQIIWELLHCENVAQVQDLALRIFQFAENEGEDCSESHRTTAEILEEAKAFIETHYTDTNLSVSVTAEAVDISVSYLTQIFKKHLGHSTIDHIHLVRLQHAKLLLAENRIKDVAEQVGYQDVRSLIRVFKKYENKTPCQFRDAESSSF